MERLTVNNRGFFELCEDTRTCNKICEENEECTDECVIQKAINKLGEYEDFEEIFRAKMSDTACEFLKDKEEFEKWIDRNKWIAKKCDEYARGEEQGLLLRLPCKVGDIIYRVNTGAKEPVIKMRVLQVHYKQLHKDRIIIRIDAINDTDMGESCYLLEDIGKTVFLTKEEAEKALERLECTE